MRKNLLKTTGSLIATLLFVIIAFGSEDSEEKNKSVNQEVKADKPLINSIWKGNDIIAGVEFIYELKLKDDKTYSLTGEAGGSSVNEKGTYKQIKENEILLINGEFKDCKFMKEGKSLNWYMDNGDFFMTLN